MWFVFFSVMPLVCQLCQYLLLLLIFKNCIIKRLYFKGVIELWVMVEPIYFLKVFTDDLGLSEQIYLILSLIISSFIIYFTRIFLINWGSFCLKLFHFNASKIKGTTFFSHLLKPYVRIVDPYI